MHQKFTKHEKFRKQNNQLPAKSHNKLEDNSILTSDFEEIKLGRYEIWPGKSSKCST